MVLAERAVECRFRDLVHWVDMVVRESKLHSLKLRWAPKKNGCFPVGKRGVSGIIKAVKQLIRAGARWHIAARSACASMGAMVVCRRSACRAGRMQGALCGLGLMGWFIQGGPLPHQFIQWSYGAPFFSRVKQNRYPIIFGQKQIPIIYYKGYNLHL